MSCDAVLVALGNPIKDSSADLFASFMPRLIKIMKLADVSRIIVLSSLGTGETIRNVTYPYKIGVQTFLKGNQADHEKGERHLIASNLNWTLVYPGPLSMVLRLNIHWLEMQLPVIKCQEHRVRIVQMLQQ